MYYIYINVYIIYTTNNMNSIYNFIYMYTAYKNTTMGYLEEKIHCAIKLRGACFCN